MQRSILKQNKHELALQTGYDAFLMVILAGPLATISCEPRQARKGAAATAGSGAGVWLVWVTSNFRRGVRAVEGARLESVYGVTHRGFESLPLRQSCRYYPWKLIYEQAPHGF